MSSKHVHLTLASLAYLPRFARSYFFYNHAYLGRYVGADLIRGGCYDDILIGGYFVRGYFGSDILSADIYVAPAQETPTLQQMINQLMLA